MIKCSIDVLQHRQMDVVRSTSRNNKHNQVRKCRPLLSDLNKLNKLQLFIIFDNPKTERSNYLPFVDL